MAGATAEDFGARVSDVRIAHWLLSGAIIIVELSSEQVEPLLEEKDSVIHVIGRAGLDQQDALVGEILGQTTGNDTASCAAADDNKVVGVLVGRREVSGRHVAGPGVFSWRCKQLLVWQPSQPTAMSRGTER